MDSNPLMKAAVESALFFGLSCDEIVQPDAAVSQLEALASTLQELTPAEKEAFLIFVEHWADEEEVASGNSPRVEFLRTLGETLGL